MPQASLRQVGVTIIAWEYERSRKKDLEKKTKDEAFRRQLDQKVLDERQVLECMTTALCG